MKKKGMLNDKISEVIASMCHMDTLVIADAGLPIPDNIRRIDLAVKKNVPSFMDVLTTVLEELQVQRVTIAAEMETLSPMLFDDIKAIFKTTEIEIIPHAEFKKKTKLAKAIIRTGEFTPYANIILESGVIF